MTETVKWYLLREEATLHPKKIHNINMTKRIDQTDDNSKQEQKYGDIGNYLGLGLQLAVTVGVMVFVGIWLDNKFNTSPWLTLGCSFFGIMAALYSFIKTVLKSGK